MSIEELVAMREKLAGLRIEAAALKAKIEGLEAELQETWEVYHGLRIGCVVWARDNIWRLETEIADEEDKIYSVHDEEYELEEKLGIEH